MADKNTVPNIKARSRLINAARLLADAGCDRGQANEITTGVLADLGLNAASVGSYAAGIDLFEHFAAVVKSYDVREAVAGDTRWDLASGLQNPDWSWAMTVLAESIIGRADHLIDYGVRHGAPLEVPLQCSMPAGFTLGDTAFLNRLSSFMDRVS